MSDSAPPQSFIQDPEHTHLIDNQVYRLLGEESEDDITLAGRAGHIASRADGHDQSSPDLDGIGVNDLDGGRVTDPLTQTPPDPQTITNAKTDDDTKLAAGGESEEETDNEDSDKEPIRDADDDKYLDPSVAARRIVMIDEIIAQFAKDSAKLADTVKNLESSLEFSYKEIADLKKENKDLKLTLGSIDTEDRRTQFQIKEVADKLDKLDYIIKKKNLLFEGIPERKKEDTDKVICDLFVQLDINRGIYFEACYRVGPFSEARPRPILVSFERQADRDLIYACRMDLKNSEAYQKVWINEDISPASKRRRDLIRLISREAQNQGIDCKTGKYAIHINKTRFDDNNLDDLPPPLQPVNLKQIRVDKDTIAYQSEHAPFSNFYHCQLIIGKHRFFCVEQAIQFLKAKTLNKPLAASRIYMSRDVCFIKQVGHDIGTSKEWEEHQYDYMYICLKKKFSQSPELKTLLLNTSTLELVEATPDRFWGCGATLSSNILRRHTWVGQNKHGKILMTVREDLRQS